MDGALGAVLNLTGKALLVMFLLNKKATPKGWLFLTNRRILAPFVKSAKIRANQWSYLAPAISPFSARGMVTVAIGASALVKMV